MRDIFTCSTVDRGSVILLAVAVAPFWVAVEEIAVYLAEPRWYFISICSTVNSNVSQKCPRRVCLGRFMDALLCFMGRVTIGVQWVSQLCWKAEFEQDWACHHLVAISCSIARLDTSIGSTVNGPGYMLLAVAVLTHGRYLTCSSSISFTLVQPYPTWSFWRSSWV